MVVERMRPLLGTFVSIRARSDLASPKILRGIALAFDAVARVQALMSAQDPASDVSRLNGARKGQRVAIHPWTRRVLQRARAISAMTGGIFDCHAIGRLSFDGIAKGFAVDRAVAALQDAGIVSGIVNAGGDLRVFGPYAEPVYVRDRAGAGAAFVGKIRNAAVATSARVAGESAIYINPRSGRECLCSASATVIALDCMTADALTKPLLIDPEAAAAALRGLGARGLRLPATETAA